jgi:hypothetical protein
MMNEYDQNWNQIKSQATMKIQSEPKIREPLELPDETVPSSKEYLETKRSFEGNKEELRRAIFGEKCHFCDLRFDEKRIIIHRKEIQRSGYLYVKIIIALSTGQWIHLVLNGMT